MKYILLLMLTLIEVASCKTQTKTKPFLITYPAPVYKETNGVKYRQHTQGITFATSPPIYSCVYCHKEFSPYQYLPKAYENIIHTDKDSVNVYDSESGRTYKKLMSYDIGYYVFIDSLKKAGISDDDWFFKEWNKNDTSCISYQIAGLQSEKIYENFIKTHAAGKYYIDSTNWMTLDGTIGGSNWASGGRFNDNILKADKWLKIKFDKK